MASANNLGIILQLVIVLRVE